MILILALLVGVADGADAVGFDEDHLGDAFVGVNLGRQRRGIADLHRDRMILEQARDDALALIEHDPGLQSLELIRLRKQVLRRYGKVLDVGDVG